MPIATFMWPSRQARPNVSVTMTATFVPGFARIAARKRAADASGSTGSRITVSGAPAFERSTPAFAQMNPWRVSLMRTPPFQRTTLTVSESTTSSWRASFPDSAAIARARGPGVTSESRTMRPARSSPRWISGRPSTAVTVNERTMGSMLTLGWKASAEQFGPRDLLRHGVLAEELGFDSVVVSDHFHPWRDTGGHAPFSFAWLGAMGASSKRVKLGTSVVTPTFRYQPAIVAQAAAT